MLIALVIAPRRNAERGPIRDAEGDDSPDDGPPVRAGALGVGTHRVALWSGLRHDDGCGLIGSRRDDDGERADGERQRDCVARKCGAADADSLYAVAPFWRVALAPVRIPNPSRTSAPTTIQWTGA